MKGIFHRTLAGGLAVAGFLALAGGAQAQQPEIILSGFGGAFDEVLAESVKSFEAENNAKVTIVAGSGATNVARIRNKEIDVIISEPLVALRMEAEGAFAKLDPALIPNLATLHPKARVSDYTAYATFGAYVLAYNPERTKPLESWYDLAKPEYKGLVGLRGNLRPENVELIVLLSKLAGGDERHPDAGFAELAKIGENVNVWITAHADHLELYRNDEIVTSIWTDGRINWAREEEGANVQAAIPKEGFFPLVSTINIIEGRPNAELSQKLVNHLLGAEHGIRMADKMGYFPTNTATVLPEEVQAKLMLNPNNIEDLQLADWQYITTVYDDWQARWEREVQK